MEISRAGFLDMKTGKISRRNFENPGLNFF
jgi:hypothetical protein